MGIFDALTTAVAGLQSQSFALQNISGNIANSQTVAYKETDTAFQDLVSSAALGQQTSGGVFANSTASNTVQGTIQNETTPTDMAIDGNGWFVVAQPAGSSGSQQQFSAVDYYTRRGDFQLNQNGYHGQWRRLRADGHSARSCHRSTHHQHAASFAVQQQFPAGAGNDADRLSGKPADLAVVRSVHIERLHGQSARWRQRRCRYGGRHRCIYFHVAVARWWFRHRL